MKPPPEPAAGLDLIKPAVRNQPAYALKAHAARRKLNQNESPYDVPPALKREIAERMAWVPWHRYPEFTPTQLLDELATRFDWPADGILVGNGSNELIQASLAVTLGSGDRVVAPAPTFSLYRLLTSVFGPYAQDDEFGSRAINPMELYHNQVTRAQGAFSLRRFHRSWGIMMIQENISAPCTVLDFPTREKFEREITKNHYDVIGISSIIVNVGKVAEMCRMARILGATGGAWAAKARPPTDINRMRTIVRQEPIDKVAENLGPTSMQLTTGSPSSPEGLWCGRGET